MSSGLNPLHLACDWPLGLDILLQAGGAARINEKSECGRTPTHFAIYYQNTATIKRLLEVGGSGYSSPRGSRHYLRMGTLRYALAEYHNVPLAVISIVIEIEANRREELKRIALNNLPAHVLQELSINPRQILDSQAWRVTKALQENGIDYPYYFNEYENAGCVYHFCPSAKIAEMLWSSGFRELDALDDNNNSALGCQHFYEGRLDMVCWLLLHGEEFTCKPGPHYELKSTISSSHYIALAWSSSAAIEGTPQYHSIAEKDMVLDALADNSRDSCKCACGIDGCSPITFALKERRLGLGRLAMLCGAEEDILRMATFSALNLTHTCCTDLGLRSGCPRSFRAPLLRGGTTRDPRGRAIYPTRARVSNQGVH